MDMSLIVFLIIIVFSAFRGYKSGAGVIFSRLITLLFAYWAALSYADSLSGWLQSNTAITGILSHILSGIIIFIFVSITLSLFFRLIAKIIYSVQPKPNEEKRPVSQISSIVGALFGGVIGIGVGIFTIWFYTTIQSILLSKKGMEAPVHSEFQSKVKVIATKAIKSAAEAVTEQQELAKAGALLLADPATNVQRLQRISQAKLIPNLLRNPDVRYALDNNNPQMLIESPAFKQLLKNQDFIELANALELAKENQDIKKELASKMVLLWNQVVQIQNNPQYIQLTNDPEIKQLLRSGNAYQMLQSKKLEELLKVISSVNVDDLSLQQPQSSLPKTQGTKEIHRWVDENGKVHYSDEKKDN